MSEEYREAFYNDRFHRLATDMPDFHPEVSHAIISLCWLHDTVSRRVNSFLAVHDLSLASFNALAILQERPRLPLNELSTLLVKTPANVTGLVDGLAKRGLVRRLAHPDDRRVKLAELSEAGRILMDTLHPQQHALVRSLFSALDEGELNHLTAMTRRVLKSLPPEGDER